MKFVINELAAEASKQYSHILDLREHRIFRHVVDILLDHPHSKNLVSLHAAVLVDGSRILAVGHNAPWQPKFVRKLRAHENFSTHAEAAVLMACRKRDLNGCRMYVARVLKDKRTIAMSRPCPYCQFSMDCAKVRRATYTTYGGNLKEMRIEAPYLKLPVMEG